MDDMSENKASQKNRVRSRHSVYVNKDDDNRLDELKSFLKDDNVSQIYNTSLAFMHLLTCNDGMVVELKKPNILMIRYPPKTEKDGWEIHEIDMSGKHIGEDKKNSRARKK